MKVIEKNNSYLVVLERGEKVIESLTQFAAEKELLGASISAIGAVENAELGAYVLSKKEYIRKTFSEEIYELIQFTGNLSLKQGKPYIHAHATLGRHDFSVFGGHFFEATVGVAFEADIRPLGVMPTRHHDEKIGLDVICGFSDL